MYSAYKLNKQGDNDYMYWLSLQTESTKKETVISLKLCREKSICIKIKAQNRKQNSFI